MANKKGVNIPATIVPFTDVDEYATHDEIYGRGGYRTVASIAERDAIPAQRRKEGMLVNVLGDKVYELKGDSFVPTKIGEGGMPNLDLQVATGKDTNGVSRIYFRINEVVKNGYVQFVRKKRNRINYSVGPGTIITRKRLEYVVMDLCKARPIPGVDVSKLTPGEWYEYPLDGNQLIETYKAGSFINSVIQRKHDIYKFTGDNSSRPLVYDSLKITNKTAVLHAGLQYNVLNEDPTTGMQWKKMFKLRGRISKIDLRMTKNGNSSAAGVKLCFVTQ